MHTENEYRKQILHFSKKAYQSKLIVGTSGNVSVYLPEEKRMLITPTSVSYEVLTEEDIVSVRLDGSDLKGKYAPSSEWQMHAAIYENCKEVTTIIHTHSPYATTFATLRKDIPTFLVEMDPFLKGSIQCAQFAPAASKELGLNAAQVLQTGRTVCLLASHGALAVGKTLEETYIRTEYLEEAATIYHHALQIGEPFPLN